MFAITLILYIFFGLLVNNRISANKCINTNNQTNKPYEFPSNQSPISNQIPNGAQLFPPYTKCHLIPYGYAYNPTVDCLSNTNNRVLTSFIPLFLSPKMLKTASLLELFIQTNYTVLFQNLISSLNTIIQLHLSLDFFSCYTTEEQATIEFGLSKYEWSSFKITFDRHITCNIDIKQGYIEFNVDSQSQITLGNFVRGLEQSIQQYGNITIKYPRNLNQTLFHTALLNEDYQFPYDCMIAKLKDYINGY